MQVSWEDGLVALHASCLHGYDTAEEAHLVCSLKSK